MARLTEKQVMELFLLKMEETQKNIKISDKKREAIIQNIEEILQKGKYNINQELERKLRELNQLNFKVDDNEFKITLEQLNKLIDNQREIYNKEEERRKKDNQKIRLSTIVFGVSILFLAFSFFMLIKSYEGRVKIEENYKEELKENGQYLSAKDAEFIDKIYKWKAKNPKDSKAWINAVNSTE